LRDSTKIAVYLRNGNYGPVVTMGH